MFLKNIPTSQTFSFKNLCQCSLISQTLTNIQLTWNQLKNIYRSIYSLDLVKLKTLKTYIVSNWANRFIQTFKFPAIPFIYLVPKPDKSFCLCVNYQGLNNLTIKNQYPLFLIRKLLTWVKKAKQFTQFYLINAYHHKKIKKSNKWKMAFKTQYN